MAQRVTTELTDDLEPNKAADETIRFGLDGIEYEIDLRSRNADKMRKVLAPFAAAGRRVGRRGAGTGTGRGARRGGASSGVDNTAVREWARSNGIELAQRGRIPRTVIDQYKEATG